MPRLWGGAELGGGGRVSELKPCPFCGGANLTPHLSDYGHPSWVRCEDCKALVFFPWNKGEDSAGLASTWNNRADVWISVKDRLPELCNHVDYDGEGWDESNPVAVIARYGTDESMGIGLYSGNNEWYVSTINDLDLYACIVTHWMPLPEPPKEEE